MCKFLIICKYIFVHFSGKANSKSTKENPVVDFEACVALVKQKTLSLVNPKPITLNQNQIAAFSYFFERAIETGLVGLYHHINIELKNFYWNFVFI